MSARVLIVEDEPSIVASLEFLVKKYGHETCIARDGKSAIEAFIQFRPHVVILDVMLPEKNGIDVCRELRAMKNGEGVRILMLTAKGANGDSARGIGAGADEYVIKPFSTRDLMARVNVLISLVQSTDGSMR